MARRVSLPQVTWRGMGEKLVTCARPSSVLLRSRTLIGVVPSAAYAPVKLGLTSAVDCRERLKRVRLPVHTAGGETTGRRFALRTSSPRMPDARRFGNRTSDFERRRITFWANISCARSLPAPHILDWGTRKGADKWPLQCKPWPHAD